MGFFTKRNTLFGCIADGTAGRSALGTDSGVCVLVDMEFKVHPQRMHIRFDGLDNVVKPGYGTIPTGVSLGDCATGMMGAPGSNKFLTRLLHPGLDHLLQIEGKRGEF